MPPGPDNTGETFAYEIPATFAEDLDAILMQLDRKGEKPRFGNFGGIRQRIESDFVNLKGQLGLEHRIARNLGGLIAHVVSKLLALLAGI